MEKTPREESSVAEITNEASKAEESTTVDEPKEVVEVLSPEELEKRFAMANELKEQGNKAYNDKNYDEAIAMYTRAIDLFSKTKDPRGALFYGNRAAAYLQLEDYESVVEDCTKAIGLDSCYLKGYMRRATAHEKLTNLSEALDDYKKVLELEPSSETAREAAKRLPSEIKVKQEKEKEQMLGQLKELGNKLLGTFGLSLDNFKFEQDNSGSYKVNFNQGKK
eukprot:TRINITY_DN2658_c0_g1_i1.p1 TRINITY_DN2658_c0_g1~~TRINITY_DN2658_c0_g1_i1.p1  ORF type:complete len:234 (+),score=47.41 TRINITY_DN2658_c0_g1_i1:39-704(+)